MRSPRRIHIIFFFNDTATTEIYTLSLHDALPISFSVPRCESAADFFCAPRWQAFRKLSGFMRSEEHTSELQSRLHLVCRLLLEKKKRSSGLGRWSGSFARLLTFDRALANSGHPNP